MSHGMVCLADTAGDDNKLWLSLDGKKLFAAERRSNGDLLKEMDVENNCSVTMVQRLTHTHVNKLQLYCKDRSDPLSCMAIYLRQRYIYILYIIYYIYYIIYIYIYIHTYI